MPDRRGRRGSSEMLIPADSGRWARSIWADRDEVARSSSGPWMLREAARILGIAEEEVDRLLNG